MPNRPAGILATFGRRPAWAFHNKVLPVLGGPAMAG
jgi:hypothetical protein